MIVRPTEAEEILPINEDLSVHYSVFKDGFTFRRPADAWRLWRKMPFEAPVSNPWIYQSFLDGAQFDCCEHVSVAIAGDATYTFMTPDGPRDYLWERGVHNVANGMGYLPAEEFVRTFRNNFTLCCIIQPVRGRTTTTRYSFEVLSGPQTLVRDALAVHFCTGELAETTVMNQATGTRLGVADNDLTIAVYLEG